MTVSSAAARSGPYAGPGSTFDYEFAIDSGEELLVTKTNAYGTETSLVFGSDFSVSIEEDGTGTFTLDTALVEGEYVTATLALDIEQPTDFTNYGAFFGETHEMALDRIVRMIKMVKEQVDRSLKVAVSSDMDVSEVTYESFIKRPALIDEETVSDAAALEVGDIDSVELLNYYGGLKLELFEIIPTTDGETLYIQLGGSGSWWTDANYSYAVYMTGNTTSSHDAMGVAYIAGWTDNAIFNQGNDASLEALHGDLRITLAQSSTANTSRTLWGSLSWATASTEPYVSIMTARYPTTKHVSAVRLYYGSGNISGKARLWGLPKT